MSNWQKFRIWLACKIAPEIHETNIMMYSSLVNAEKENEAMRKYLGDIDETKVEKGPRIN